ncbi:DUF4129 domain-containing protein [Bacteroides sp.]
MTAQADTLVCDTIRVAYWQSQPAYDYNRELVTPELDVWGWLNAKLAKLLSAVFGSSFAEEYTGLVLLCLTAVMLVFLLWILYKKHPELFVRSSRRSAVAYSVHEDTIYGVDFQQEITNALQRQDYREAMRLLYLQTLKQLSDAEKIDWQLYKTPTEYIYELKAGSLRASFRELTNRFLRVRYGNYEATAPLFHEMQALQAEMAKGGGG